jgi:hypothetical protein
MSKQWKDTACYSLILLFSFLYLLLYIAFYVYVRNLCANFCNY